MYSLNEWKGSHTVFSLNMQPLPSANFSYFSLQWEKTDWASPTGTVLLQQDPHHEDQTGLPVQKIRLLQWFLRVLAPGTRNHRPVSEVSLLYQTPASAFAPIQASIYLSPSQLIPDNHHAAAAYSTVWCPGIRWINYFAIPTALLSCLWMSGALRRVVMAVFTA